MYADISVDGETVRVLNLHLTLTHPNARAEELEKALLHRDPRLLTIVCGDLNVIESPKMSLLNWILGGSLLDMLLFSRARKDHERRFTHHELSNPLAGKSTHPLSRSQLDHILLSKHFVVQDARVISNRHGSDHHPIVAQILQEKSE